MCDCSKAAEAKNRSAETDSSPDATPRNKNQCSPQTSPRSRRTRKTTNNCCKTRRVLIYEEEADVDADDEADEAKEEEETEDDDDEDLMADASAIAEGLCCARPPPGQFQPAQLQQGATLQRCELAGVAIVRRVIDCKTPGREGLLDEGTNGKKEKRVSIADDEKMENDKGCNEMRKQRTDCDKVIDKEQGGIENLSEEGLENESNRNSEHRTSLEKQDDNNENSNALATSTPLNSEKTCNCTAQSMQINEKE